MTDYISDNDSDSDIDSICDSKADTFVKNVNTSHTLFRTQSAQRGCVKNAYHDEDSDLLSPMSSCGSSSIEDSFDWNPPKTSGLRNSFPIVQRCHIEKMERGEKIDYFEIMKDDLRNIRPLTKAKFEYIKDLQPHQLFEIIEIYNNVTKLLMQIAELPQDD